MTAPRGPGTPTRLGATPGVPPLSAHYHASRLRADTWSALKQAAAGAARAGSAAERAAAQVGDALEVLEAIESYWAFPGKAAVAHLRELAADRRWEDLLALTARILRGLTSQAYRQRHIPLLPGEEPDAEDALEPEGAERAPGAALGRPYFEVLVVDRVAPADEEALRQGLRGVRRPEDRFVYDPVVVPSFEDAVIAVLFNFNVQAVVVRYDFPFRSAHRLERLEPFLGALREEEREGGRPGEAGPMLGAALKRLRPELDLYLVTDERVEDLASDPNQVFRRVFYRQEDFVELHLNILGGIAHRYRTPFFTALRAYAEQPTGVFHALPISRGKSVVKSNWIQDMAQFYGLNIFLAETSSTSGGLDSLLDPRGTIKEAQELSARAFGARRTYFVTNGTSTANKIVVQALVQPGDIVLVDRNCHKSHHYALVLAGAHVVYLDSYPLDAWSMFGAVPLATILAQLERLREAGVLDRLRLVLLTNCTFDGIVYHPERVMMACLAVKPDLAFVWDEAWFAFARFSPLYRPRTAMEAARVLRRRFASPEYLAEWEAAGDRSALPDPRRARVRVYATQSTHKTLTALRQGSMIHVHDQEFARVEHAFRDAFMTHTSTSPNYQILASLDVGRRQVELEGFELVNKQVELAMQLRERVGRNPRLNRWFRILTSADLIPEPFRPSGLTAYYDQERGWEPMAHAWAGDEFVLDPCRLTLYIGPTGIDGDTFRREHLMARHGIQVNKTSRNSVLFMTHIGTTRSSVAHLLDVLSRLADRLEEDHEDEGEVDHAAWERSVDSLCRRQPPLPHFSRFHRRFCAPAAGGGEVPAGDLRAAFFLGQDERNCRHLRLGGPIEERLAAGEEVVAATFVTPYPPGFPILVPGQVISREILDYLSALDTKEIHGYRPDWGLRVLRPERLEGA